jgi:hypothetical protein
VGSPARGGACPYRRDRDNIGRVSKILTGTSSNAKFHLFYPLRPPTVHVPQKGEIDLTNPDLIMLAVLLFAILAALLAPPGPGSPLQERVQDPQ